MVPYECPCGRTITLTMRAYLSLSAYEINLQCIEGKGYGESDAFYNSHLSSSGERVLTKEKYQEDEDDIDDIDEDNPEVRDFSLYSEAGIQFEE